MSEELFGQIAIIGMSGRFPGAPDLDTYWQNLANGVESIRTYSDEELIVAGVDPDLLNHDRFVKAGAELADPMAFDASFFGFAPAEAVLMDPQFRLSLETAWHALEDAGYDPDQTDQRIGVFYSMSMATYIHRLMEQTGVDKPESTLRARIFNDKDFLATLISYKLNLTGPSFNVQTACSSSLVAVHLAIQSLLSGECELALAGGAAVAGSRHAGYMFYEGGINSPDGHCRPFDAEAAGTVSGNGVGLVVLKKLQDALDDGDHIAAVILGTALNNDGATKVSFTAPSISGQSEAIGEALLVADVGAETIKMIEAHGTGTALGDPTEIEALTSVYRNQTDAVGFCGIGSVKSNIGHLDAAAGVAGLIKCTLALKNQLMPPTLHYHKPNPNIPFEQSPFFVLDKPTPWVAGDEPRRAALSSFGVGGTNVHAILEEAPPVEPGDPDESPQLLVLSAKNPEALALQVNNLAAFLEQSPNLNLADAAYTLQVGRRPMEFRHATCAASTRDAIDALRADFVGKRAPDSPELVFMFPGQGTQFPSMIQGLMQEEGTFQDTINICLTLLSREFQLDLAPLLFADTPTQEAALRLNQTRYTQPALFVVCYALAKHWQAMGIQPLAMIGMSIGEYVAATLADVFSLEEALRLVALRGRLIGELSEGAMTSVGMSAHSLREQLPPELDITAINSPENSVVGGPVEAVTAFEQALKQAGVSVQRLHTSHAFHSRMMDPITESFRQTVASIQRNEPRLPFISNVSGTWITKTEAVDPDYWVAHLRSTIQWSRGLSTLLENNDRVFLEVGPGSTLGSLLRRQPNQKRRPLICSLPDRKSDADQPLWLLQTLGKLWSYGLSPDWRALHAGKRRCRPAMPTYPFQRQIYQPADQPSPKATTLEKQPQKDWFYLPSWYQAPLPLGSMPEQGAYWLVLGASSELLEQLKDQIGADRVISVTGGDQFAETRDGYVLTPDQTRHYEALFQKLKERGSLPKYLVHAWNLGAGQDISTQWDTIGFYALTALANALRKAADQTQTYLLCLSDGLQNVTGEEHIIPEKATLLGPVKVIPKELSTLKCASLDVTSDIGPKRTALTVMAEMAAGLPEPQVAVRYAYRWALDYLGCALPSQKPEVKAGSTYLIAGGLGGVGLTLAECLAQQEKVNLMLTGRQALPPRGQWDQYTGQFAKDAASLSADAANITFDIAEALHSLEEMEAAINDDLVIPVLPQKDVLEQRLDLLCAAWIADYFRRGGVILKPGKSYLLEALSGTLRILPKFEKFFNVFVKVLREDEFATVADDRLTFTDKIETMEDPRTLSREMAETFPEFAAVFSLLEHCASHYVEALSGDIEAIGVLYPEGRSDLLLNTAKETSAFSKDNLYQKLLRNLILRLVGEKERGPLRILEVGAGNGQLTKILVDGMDAHQIQYTYTDLGKSFVLKGEREAAEAGRDFMRFSVFDITQPPEKQGLARNEYDLVVGFDVVHATRDIAQSTENIRALLAPNGMMCLVESVRTNRWVDMVWGLAEGWWHFEDYHLRKDSPLMPPETWERALESRFDHVVCYPRSKAARRDTDFTLVLAQQHKVLQDPEFLKTRAKIAKNNWQTNQRRIKAVKAIEARGSKVLSAAADITDEQAMRRVVDETVEAFGAVHGAINATGILEDSLIQMKTAESAARVLAPKVTGTLVLERVLADQSLDFTLLCSSLAALQGNITQVDHCAANCFLDAYAQAAPNNGRRISINWGTWRDVGLASSMATDKLSGLKQERARFGMNPEEGKNAFLQALASGLPQVVVSTTDLKDTLETDFELNLIDTPQPTAPMNLHQRPELTVPYKAPENPLHEMLCAMWGELLGIDKIGVDDNFFDLGADSLMGITLVNRLQTKLDEIVHITALLDAPTVVKLANYLRNHYPEAVARVSGETIADKTEDADKPVEQATLDSFRDLIQSGEPRYGKPEQTLKEAVFVISAPRSGSTLLRVMLGGHPMLFAPPEMDLMPFADLLERREALIGDTSMLEGATEALMQARNISAQTAESQMRAFENSSLSSLQFYQNIQDWIAPKILVEKSPSYALNPATLERIEQTVENPRFIHLVRHPYGMIHSYEEARLDLLFGSEIRARMPFTRRQLAELTWTLSEQNIRAFLTQIPPERGLRVRYEDLVTRPDEEMKRISAFIGIDYDTGMLDPYREKAMRMTGGLHRDSRMLGDVKFHDHKGITASAADRWRKRFSQDFLGPPAQQLAVEMGYPLIAEDPQPKGVVTPSAEPSKNTDEMEAMVADLSGEDLDEMLKQMMKGGTQ